MFAMFHVPFRVQPNWRRRSLNSHRNAFNVSRESLGYSNSIVLQARSDRCTGDLVQSATSFEDVALTRVTKNRSQSHFLFLMFSSEMKFRVFRRFNEFFKHFQFSKS